MTRIRGFTLIEVMVTLVIVAIIAAIAIPSYRLSVIKGNRRAAQSVMMEIVNRQHQYFNANRVYADAATLGFVLPPEVSGNYTLAISTAPPEPPTPGFTVTLTAIGSQVGDGDLTLNSVGDKTPEDKW